MGQPMMRVGAVMAKEQGSIAARMGKTQGWLAQLGHYPGAEALAILAHCESGAESLLAWEFARKSTPNVDECAFSDERLHLAVQVRESCYRLDMVATTPALKLAIEVDGYFWHQLSEDQVEQDHLRARRLTALGYRVIRFSAREVYRDPAACWSQVEKIIEENG